MSKGYQCTTQKIDEINPILANKLDSIIPCKTNFRPYIFILLIQLEAEKGQNWLYEGCYQTKQDEEKLLDTRNFKLQRRGVG